MTVVARRAIRQEKRRLPILIAVHQLAIKTPVCCAVAEVFEAVQHVGCMKIIDPSKIRGLPVIPEAIISLILGRVSHGSFRKIPKRAIPVVKPGSGKQASPE